MPVKVFIMEWIKGGMMNKKKMIEHLESLVEYCKNMIYENEPGNTWEGDMEALKLAIEKFTSECDGNDAQEIIRNILVKEGMTQQQLADKAGMVRQNISQMLTRGSSMRFSSFKTMAEVLGYEIVCRNNKN